jgi:hypothetical protein
LPLHSIRTRPPVSSCPYHHVSPSYTLCDALKPAGVIAKRLMVDRTNGRLMIVPARRPGYPGLIHFQVHPIHLLCLYIMLSAISSYIAPYFQEEIVAMPDEKLILLGTHDNYIHSALFNPITKSIRPGRSTRTDPHPSWLTRHPSVHITQERE